MSASTATSGSSNCSFTAARPSDSIVGGEPARELPRQIRSFSRVAQQGLGRDVARPHRLGAGTQHVGFGHRLVAQVLEGGVRDAVLRPRGIQQVAGEHRVERHLHVDAVRRQRHQDRLRVVGQRANGRILQQRAQRVDGVAAVHLNGSRGLAQQVVGGTAAAVAQRQVGPLAIGVREREPDQLGLHAAGRIGHDVQRELARGPTAAISASSCPRVVISE